MRLELSEDDPVLEEAVEWVFTEGGLPFPVYLELEILDSGRDPDEMRYELEEVLLLT